MAVLKPTEGKWGSAKPEQGESWGKQTSSKVPLERSTSESAMAWPGLWDPQLCCYLAPEVQDDTSARDETGGNLGPSNKVREATVRPLLYCTTA